jgi:hypothetical protein
MLVQFTSSDLASVVSNAAAVTGRSIHIPNRTYGRHQTEIDSLALRGEFAVAKLFGLPIDACPVMAKGIDMGGKSGMQLPGGRTVKIKAAERGLGVTKPYWFILPNVTDLGILTYVRPDDQVEIAGYCTHADWITHNSEVNFGYGPFVGIRADAMRPITELLAAKCVNRWGGQALIHCGRCAGALWVPDQAPLRCPRCPQ